MHAVMLCVSDRVGGRRRACRWVARTITSKVPAEVFKAYRIPINLESPPGLGSSTAVLPHEKQMSAPHVLIDID
jgi:hypothetical protein